MLHDNCKLSTALWGKSSAMFSGKFATGIMIMRKLYNKKMLHLQNFNAKFNEIQRNHALFLDFLTKFLT